MYQESVEDASTTWNIRSSSETFDRRQIFKRIKTFCEADAELARSYEAAKAIIRTFRKSAFYEVSTRCNLFCEGCYYFENSKLSEPPVDGNKDIASWKGFFQQEAERGVSMAYFVGAEPALHQERLVASLDTFQNGNIGTNGTIKITQEVPYRIAVSVWAGNEETDKKLRGASAFRKALRLYEGDARVIMLFTVSAWNMEEVPLVAHLCREHGVDLTFNLYSPTVAFRQKLSAGIAQDSNYIRESTIDDTPCLNPEHLPRVRDLLDQATDDFQGTVVYSHAYNRFVTQPGSLFDLDARGVAKDCGSRIIGNMSYFYSDQTAADVKCCTPDIECKNCRMYSAGWSRHLVPNHDDVASKSAFNAWLDTVGVLGRIFLMRHVPASN